MTRRELIQFAALAARARPLAAAGPAFSLPALPYSYDALEPWIDAQTMQIHHDKHHQAYVDNLNKAVAGEPSLAGKSVEDLLRSLDSLPATVKTAVRNQGGGHANHTLFWQSLAPASKQKKPVGKLADSISQTFGGQDKLEDGLRTMGASVFGSGWVWLSLDRGNKLVLGTLPNQDSPISLGNRPLLGIDVWEHAYYLKYQNRRPEYLAAILKVINWDFVSSRFEEMNK